MRLEALCALLACVLTATSSDVSPVDSLRSKLFRLEEDLWRNVTDPKWNEKVELGADVELTKAFIKLNEDIEAVPKQNKPILTDSWLWSKATEKLQIINGLYKEFLDFSKRQAIPGSVPAPVKDWLDLTEHVLMDPKSSVVQAVKKLDDILEHGDLFRTVLQEEHPYLCDMQLSQHQLIYDMYNTISLTEIKGYAMMQFSWMLLRIYDKGNFTQEASLTRQRYGERTVKTAVAARNALAMAKRDLNRCDPAHHVEGETFAQVTLLLQGYIENEVDMNTEGTCKENCAYYTLAERHGCFKDMFCSQQRQCRGRIINCQYIDSDMTICPSKKTNRRYDWIEYENGRNLGKSGTCSYATKKVDSWWRWNLLHCSYCFCLCEDEPQRSQRFFSMIEALADESKNKVVTGLRMVKKDRVFHLQVSEGTLGPSGAVTPQGWVPVQVFDPEDIGRMPDVDYHMLTYEKRAMDLDELDSPQGHILTGVRFRMIGSHLHFEIRSTPFNFTTGRLFPERSQWISNDNTEGADTPRSQLMLHRPDIPTRSRVPLPVDSKHDQYIEFTNSDLESDVAQSTVPFIDIQELMPTEGSSLLSGAGIIHRGAPGSGGFVAVKLFTYDYSRHVYADPPPSTINEEVDSMDFMPVIN